MIDFNSRSRLAVSIHAPAGGATIGGGIGESCSTFQSTRPRGARHRRGADVPALHVSIHAPAGGATAHERQHMSLASRFNPRARGGRDYLLTITRILITLVSIHAPAGGATSFFRFNFLPISVFQSTRPQGARRRDLVRRYRCCPRFNPRARGGRDPADHLYRRPAGGFNPRARGVRDDVEVVETKNFRKFQSTRPRGARRCEGGLFVARCLVSIHAPAGGATSYDCINRPFLFKFQSTRLRGARPLLKRAIALHRLFQSTRPRGARPRLSRRQRTRKTFQSTRPQGARRTKATSQPHQTRFNPRARGGRDDRDK